MLRTETKIVEVSSGYDQTTIDLMNHFSWKYHSSETIMDRFNPLKQLSKIVFQRDLELPNIEKIKQLELEYNTLLENPVQVPNYKNTEALPFWSGIAVLILFWYVFSFTVGICIGAIVGISIWILYYSKNNQLTEEYKKANVEYENKLKNILNRSAQL